MPEAQKSDVALFAIDTVEDVGLGREEDQAG